MEAKFFNFHWRIEPCNGTMVDQIMDIGILKKISEILKEAWLALQKSDDPKLRDTILNFRVKRFEYTVEMAWKSMRKFLNWYMDAMVASSQPTIFFD